MVWGDAWADGWGWDHRRWQVAIPHLEVPPSANLEAYLPPDARAVWVVGAGEGGAFGTVQGESPTTGGALVLKIDSAPIAVRVWDERKRPVPGVMLADASSPLETGAVTDDDGRAVAQLPMTGEWNLIATGPGAVALKAGRGRPQAEVDLDLKPRDDIELSWPKELGTVVLHVSTSSNRFGRAPVTFSGGVAVLPRTPSSVSIDFWGPGIAPGRMQLTDAAGRLPLKAAAAVRIEGRVVSEIDTPVAGLPVWVHISSSANARYQGYGSRGGPARLERPWLPWSVTDAAGRFSVAGLPPAEYEVEVRAPGLPTARSGRLEGAPGAVLETTVTLNAGATLALRIVDPEGNPLAGAVVDLHRSAGRSGGANRMFVVGRRGSDGDPEVTVFTDEEGRARLASAPVGAVRLRLIRPGSVSRTIDGIEVPPEGLDIGDQVLEPGVTLTGTTVGPDGEPVGEAEVALERNPQTPFFQATTASDEDGRFSIHDLEPKGEVYLQARAEGLVPDAPLKVEMPTDGEIEVVMAEERFLEGLVLDARDDGPIEGAEVRLSITRTTSVPGLFAGRSSASVGESKTGTTGRFIFEGLSAGEFGLSVAAEGRRPVRQTVVIGESDPESVIIRMEPGLELRGRVETADGEPAAGVSVFASTSSQSIDGRQAIGSSTQSAADGRFHFNDLSPGTQSVSARSEDGMNARATAEAGQPDEVVLRFPRGTVISGTVYGPDGSPFNGSTVRGFGSGASQRLRTRRDRMADSS